MLFSTLIAMLQDAPAPANDGQGTVKLIAGVLAVVLLGVIILRRRGSAGKKKDEDEF